MFAKLKNLISGSADTPKDEPQHHSVDERKLAAAVLLVEAAQRDDDFTAEEEANIMAILQRQFDLSDDDARELIVLAHEKQGEAVELHSFTRSVKDLFDFEERIEMIEMLWEVAYADGELHDFEADLVRKVAGLIYVSDRDRGDARKRVVERLNISEG